MYKTFKNDTYFYYLLLSSWVLAPCYKNVKHVLSLEYNEILLNTIQNEYRSGSDYLVLECL
jgi:hypothetical protein